MANPKTLAVSGILYTDRRDFYITPQQYAALYPNATPFLSDLLAAIPQNAGTLKDPTYKMFEHRAGWRKQYFDANGTASWGTAGAPGDTVTVTVDGATGIGDSNNTIDSSLVGREVEIWTANDGSYKGNALVRAVNSATEIVLVSISNTGAANEQISNIADDDRFYVLGGAYGEESESPEGATDEMEVVWNSCFIHRTPFSLSETTIEAQLRGESNELMRIQTTKGQEHKIQLNNKLYRGARRGGIGGTAHSAGGGTDSFADTHVTDADGYRARNTMGLISAFRRYGRTSGDSQNVFSHNISTVTYNDLLEDADKANQYNPTGQRKRLYSGPGFYTWLNKIGAEGLVTKMSKTRVNIEFTDGGTNRLGQSVKVLVLGDVEFEVIKDESLRFTPYKNWAHSIDMNNIGIVRYQPDAYHADIKKDNKPLLQKDEYFSYMGLKLELMESHAEWQLAE